MSLDTRMKLLLAAERLFALHGPDGASARMIVAEAGQKNASALNYYFETREALIEAICELRMSAINADRIEQVASYLSERPKPSERLRTLIEILCLPGLAPIYEAKGKSYFRRFLAQAINNPSTKFADARGSAASATRRRRQAHRHHDPRDELLIGASRSALRGRPVGRAQGRT